MSKVKGARSYAVVDVTKSEVVDWFSTDVAASKKADERPRDWMPVHESRLAALGIKVVPFRPSAPGMTERQRKVLADGFVLLANGARAGKRKAEEGTVLEVLDHVGEMEAMLAEVRKALQEHVGASAVLEKIEAARAAERKV